MDYLKVYFAGKDEKDRIKSDLISNQAFVKKYFIGADVLNQRDQLRVTKMVSNNVLEKKFQRKFPQRSDTQLNYNMD